MKTAIFAVTIAGLCASQALATVTYSFYNITGNSLADATAGEAQLFVDVDPAGPGQVSFTFRNVGPAAMSITDVYFDDGTLLGIASVINGPGVNFSQGASPPNLPGGASVSPPFVTTAGFLADSNPPAQPNGVNPGEWVTIVFNLIGGQTYADTINALDGGIALRIGIHVQGFSGGGSESFINNVPTPGALGLMGVAGLLASRRRR